MSAATTMRTLVRRDASFVVGSVIVGAALILALIGPYIVPHPPQEVIAAPFLPPSPSHLFGTDAAGMDVFSRSIAAFRVDVVMAVIAVGASSVIGTLLGAFAGFSFSSRVARALCWALLRVTDMVQAFPVFIMAFALVGTFGPSEATVVVAIAFVSVPAFLRIARGSVLSNEKLAYVDAAKVMGLRERTVLLRHVLPNSLDAVIANASIAVGIAILMTTGLSFIGAGVRPPTPEWGVIIAGGSTGLVTGAWWISILPGVLLVVTVSGFALLGDGVRRFLDPAQRQRLRSKSSVGGA